SSDLEKRRAEAGSESGEIDEGGGPDAAAEDVETHPHQARGEKPDEEDRERLLADGADECDEPPPAQTLDEACPARSRRDPGQPGEREEMQEAQRSLRGLGGDRHQAVPEL